MTANQISLASHISQSQPFTGFAIVGGQFSVDRVNEACAAADVELSAEEFASLDVGATALKPHCIRMILPSLTLRFPSSGIPTRLTMWAGAPNGLPQRCQSTP